MMVSRKKMEAEDTPKPQKCYSVTQVAKIFQTTKTTIYKWLQEEDGEAVIDRKDWLKLPRSGHIRIMERAIKKLMDDEKG